MSCYHQRHSYKQFGSWKRQVKLFAFFVNLGFVMFQKFYEFLITLFCFMRGLIFFFFFCPFWGEVGGDWKRLKSEELGISTSMIAKPTIKVMNGLKRKGITWLIDGFYIERIMKELHVCFYISTCVTFNGKY